MVLDANSICGLVDDNLASLIHTIVMILKVAVPLVLILIGMLDFGKGVLANKEDEIKQGQRIFIKRLVSAVIIFFVVSIVQLVVNIADDGTDGNVWDCANYILNGSNDGSGNFSVSDQDDSDTAMRRKCCAEANGDFSNSNCFYNGMTDEESEIAHEKFEKCYRNAE